MFKNMTYENYIQLFVLSIVIFSITTFLLKSLVKALVITTVGIFLFRIAFVYSSDEIIDNLHLEEILKDESKDKVYKGIEKYTETRDKHNKIIDVDNIDDKIKEKENKVKEDLNKKIDEYKNNAKK